MKTDDGDANRGTAEAARLYDDAQLASLVISIAAINAWNRLNVTTRQPAGAWR